MLERKGLPIRLAAIVIDSVLVGIVAWIATMIVTPSQTAAVEKALTSTPAEFEAWNYRLAGWRNMIVGLFGLGLAAMEIITAQTPGKMLLKLRVQSEAGVPATREQLIRRSALKYGAYPFYFLGGLLAIPAIVFVGFIPALIFFIGAFMATRPNMQGLHDQLGKTAVYGPPGVGVMPAGFAVMPGQVMPPAGTPVTPPPETTMPPPPQV